MAQVSRTDFKTATNALYPDNTSGQISPADLRAQMDNIADSAPFKGTGKNVAPGANDDSNGTGGNGAYNVGDIWMDETANVAYICADDTVATAIWLELSNTGNPIIFGTPAVNQVAFWLNDQEIQSDSSFTYNTGQLTISEGAPILELVETGAAADNQRWWLRATSEEFRLNALTDAGTAGSDYAAFTRTGNNLDALIMTLSGATRTSLTPNGLIFTGGVSSVGTTDSQALHLQTGGITRLICNELSNTVDLPGDGANSVLLNVGNSAQTTGSAAIQIGNGRTGDGAAYLDFITDAATYTDYGFRFTRAGGADGVSQFIHRGTGNYRIRTQETADIRLETNNTAALIIDGTTQDCTFNSDINAIGSIDVGVDANITGNVGIGRIPEVTMDIESATPIIRLRDTDVGASGYAQITSGTEAPLILQADVTNVEADSYIAMEVDGSEVARFDATGNLTIAGTMLSLVQTQDETTTTFRRIRPTESGYSYEMNNAAANTIEVIGDKDFAMSGATQANPVVITVADTIELETGDEVAIASVVGMTELNGNNYLITVLDGTTFSLQTLAGADVDGTSYTAYTSGGIATRQALTYPVGFHCEIIQMGAGTTTVQVGSLITLNGQAAAPGGVGGDITAQFDVVRLRRTSAANTWIVDGDIGVIS